jgi:radical SAM superfamily enzyme YgiQ (UPF0313 family)
VAITKSAEPCQLGVLPEGEEEGAKSSVNLVMVNTISPYYLVRYQGPLAVNVLSEYVERKVQEVSAHRVDMQADYDDISLKEGLSVEESFRLAVIEAVDKICEISQEGPTVVGLSIKWAAVEVAKTIIEGVRNGAQEEILYVLGNIGATFGYEDLLTIDPFQGAIAVVGEGEEALSRIVARAVNQNGGFSNASSYADIPNVAVNIEGTPTVGSIERVDLDQYPPGLNDSADLYNKAWDVHCLDTSRGCPWSCCTFCSVKGQFGGGENSGWQPFPEEVVLGNMKDLVEQGVRKFDIQDSEFFGPVRSKNGQEDPFWETMARAKRLAQGLKDINSELEEGDKATIHHMSARVDTIHSVGEDEKNATREEVYSLLKEAGLKGVYLGIESGSKSQLRRFGKGVSVEENKMALEIMRRLGFQIEVGFIFFDYLATMEELQENVEFIEETELYKTDSRILGSLRVQEGSPYKKMARNKGLLGKKHDDFLGYKCDFLNDDVAELEKIFIRWERATVKLIKMLPFELSLKVREMDFSFMKALVDDFVNNDGQSKEDIVRRFCELREKFLEKVKGDEDVWNFNEGNPQLLEEYLRHALNQNRKGL